jgi:hypothetical protein
VAPLIEEYMEQRWPSTQYHAEMTPVVTQEWLVQLNQNLMIRLRLMDPDHTTRDLTRQLNKCGFSRTFKGSFLTDYVSKMKKDLVAQLQEHVADLVQLIQDDLQDDYLDD